MIWESESFKSMIHDPVFFLFMHRATDPSLPCITLSQDETCQFLSFEQYTVFGHITIVTNSKSKPNNIFSLHSRHIVLKKDPANAEYLLNTEQDYTGYSLP